MLSCLTVALLVCLCAACCRRMLLKSLSKGTPTSSESPRSSSVPSCVTSTGSETSLHQKTRANRSPSAVKGGPGLPAPHSLRNGRSLPRRLPGTQAAAAGKSDVVVQVIASDRLGWNGLPRQKRERSPSSPSTEGVVGTVRPISPWKVVLGLSSPTGSKLVVPKPVLPEDEEDLAMRRSPRGSGRRAPLPPTPPELNTIDEGEEPTSRSIPMPGNTGTTDASGAGTQSLSLHVPATSPSRSLPNVAEEDSSSGSFGWSEDLDVTPSNSTSLDESSRDNLGYSPGGSRLSPRRGSAFSGTADRRALLTDVVPRPGPMSTGPSSPERDVPRALLSEPAVKNAASSQPALRLHRQSVAQELRRTGSEMGDMGPGSGPNQVPSCSSSVGRACAIVDNDSCDPMLRSKSFLTQGHSDELIPQTRLLESMRALDSARSDAWRTLAGERLHGDGLDATSTFGSCSNTFFLVPPKSLSREPSGELAADGDLRDGLSEMGRRGSHATRLKRMSDELTREARAAMRGMRSTDEAE